MNKINKILNLLEFITEINFKELPENIKKEIISNKFLSNYIKILKSSHFYRIVYPKENITFLNGTLENLKNKTGFDVTIKEDKNQLQLLFQYKEKNEKLYNH